MAIQLEGNTLLYTVTTLTCLGFLLIGFDNGLMGGFVNSPAFTETFGIDPDSDRGANLIGLIVSIYEIGCFVGAITTSFIGEKLGRRKSVLIGVIIMIVGKSTRTGTDLRTSTDNSRCYLASYCVPPSPHDHCKNHQRHWHGLHQLNSASFASRVQRQGYPWPICLCSAVDTQFRYVLKLHSRPGLC